MVPRSCSFRWISLSDPSYPAYPSYPSTRLPVYPSSRLHPSAPVCTRLTRLPVFPSFEYPSYPSSRLLTIWSFVFPFLASQKPSPMSYGWQSPPGLELRTRLLQLGGFTRLSSTPSREHDILGRRSHGTAMSETACRATRSRSPRTSHWLALCMVLRGWHALGAAALGVTASVPEASSMPHGPVVRDQRHLTQPKTHEPTVVSHGPD